MPRGRKRLEEIDVNYNPYKFINDGIKKYGNIQDFAVSLGWNRDQAKKCIKRNIELSPSGSRREHRIRSDFNINDNGDEIDWKYLLQRNNIRNKKIQGGK